MLEVRRALAQKSILLTLVAALAACTRHSPAIDGPGRGEGPGYVWPDEAAPALAESFEPGHSYGVARRTIHEPETSYTAPLPYLATGTPPPSASVKEGGRACLRALSKAGVRYRPLPDLRGVATPVEIRGALGGVEYWVVGTSPLQMDCRLALTLTRVGKVLTRHGVSRIRFSGAYVYKTAPSGRLSHHAHGLAIDLHEFSVRGASLSVDRAFSRNAGCQGRIPTLNRLACDLRATSYFDEFLTPDYNAAHRDHLHVSVPLDD